MHNSTHLDPLPGGRPIYLWGASQTGLGMMYALHRRDVEVTGFIDKRKDLQGGYIYGLPVYGPEEILHGPRRALFPFIINATFQHKNEISSQCEAAGLLPGVDFVYYEQLSPFDYQVVVSGICNLRCISCPLGNMPKKAPAGIMSASSYARVLDKILKENPYLGIIQLYNWGEPLLNPELAAIIRLTNERQVLCAVSSNLSLARDFEDVIQARPGCFRVSLSGWGETYAITHTRGNWDLVLSNMQRLSELRARYCPEMPVEVTYHLYKHNHDDAQKIRLLCEKLGFVFRPHMAALLPLDNVASYLHGGQLSPQANNTIEMLMLPIDRALKAAAKECNLSCNFEHAINIDWDLTVKHCGLYYSRTDNIVAASYLETSLEEILAQRRKSRLCRTCREKGLHRFCRFYTGETPDLEE
jgi:MoaA/NifB/PqqE/SkfB family radical SAM enzyme